MSRYSYFLLILFLLSHFFISRECAAEYEIKRIGCNKYKATPITEKLKTGTIDPKRLEP